MRCVSSWLRFRHRQRLLTGSGSPQQTANVKGSSTVTPNVPSLRSGPLLRLGVGTSLSRNPRFAAVRASTSASLDSNDCEEGDVIDTRLDDPDVVDSEHTPEVIAFNARRWRAHVDCCPVVAVARRGEIPLASPEGGAIRTTLAAVGVGGRS